MERPAARLEAIGEKVRAQYAEKDAAREKGLKLSREAIRFSSNTIRAVHRREYDEARGLLDSVRELITEMGRALAEHSDLFHSGFVHNAQKEYAEAAATLALVCGEPVPDPDDLGISYAAYLNGLGEAAGEMRRHLLDTIRSGEMERCEQVLEVMDDIYALLVTIDYPDALTGGLRRTTDMVRGILERTRGDLTLSLRQRDLEQKLNSFKEDRGERKPGGENGYTTEVVR